MHRLPLLAAMAFGSAALACSSTQASPPPAAPTEVPIARGPAAPPLEGKAGGATEEAASDPKGEEKRRKNRECNALIEVINAGIDELEKPHNLSPVARFRHMAEVMDGVGAKAAKVKLTRTELQKYAGTYMKMTRDVAKASRDMAAAVEAKDTAQVQSAKDALDEAAAREDPIVNEINRFCQAP
jgi:hypothetical protein